MTTIVEFLVAHRPEPLPAPRRSPGYRPALAAAAALVFFVWSAFATSGVALASKAFDLEVLGYNPCARKGRARGPRQRSGERRRR